MSDCFIFICDVCREAYQFPSAEARKAFDASHRHEGWDDEGEDEE